MNNTPHGSTVEQSADPFAIEDPIRRAAFEYKRLCAEIPVDPEGSINFLRFANRQEWDASEKHDTKLRVKRVSQGLNSTDRQTILSALVDGQLATVRLIAVYVCEFEITLLLQPAIPPDRFTLPTFDRGLDDAASLQTYYSEIGRIAASIHHHVLERHDAAPSAFHPRPVLHKATSAADYPLAAMWLATTLAPATTELLLALHNETRESAVTNQSTVFAWTRETSRSISYIEPRVLLYSTPERLRRFFH